MKKLNSIYTCLIATLFLASCGVGGNNLAEASDGYQQRSKIISKKALDYDNVLGVKIPIEKIVATDTSKIEIDGIWVQVSVLNELPEPSDSVEVFAEYITGDFRKTGNISAGEVNILFNFQTVLKLKTPTLPDSVSAPL